MSTARPCHCHIPRAWPPFGSLLFGAVPVNFFGEVRHSCPSQNCTCCWLTASHAVVRGDHGGSRGFHVTNALGKGSGWRQSKQNQAPHAVAVYCLRVCGPDPWTSHDAQLLGAVPVNFFGEVRHSCPSQNCTCCWLTASHAVVRGDHGGSRGFHVTNALGKGSGWRQSKQNQAPHAVAVYCLRVCGPDPWTSHDAQLLFHKHPLDGWAVLEPAPYHVQWSYMGRFVRQCAVCPRLHTARVRVCACA